jgi:hypothetical protein
LFFFKEGYLRLSSADYSVDNLANDYVHLTNNAIQKHCPDYGLLVDGNQLGFNDLRQYLKKEGVDFDKVILP